ncbi:hypothetical protein LCGC14_0692860 [marine sediment metagenome]|uniref:Uncharacterized protein n=1 Tax=marine sediment metagenome TaxID=412755 RepID=A0A0F9QPW6_9ZZZZ
MWDFIWNWYFGSFAIVIIVIIYIIIQLSNTFYGEKEDD